MTPLARAAVEIARQAGALLRDQLTQARTVDFKGAGHVNLVTDADRASEALILAELARRFPDHAVLAEEGGHHPGPGQHLWFVDPLDGTTNYAHGVPHFCVTLAVQGPTETGDALLAAVVYDPMRDECFWAARGQGAFLDEHRLVVSDAPALDRALVCTGFPYDLQERPDAPLGLFNRLITQVQGVRRMGSAALDLAYVAAGRFDGFFEFGLKPWDIAAGALLVTEAGGVVHRIDGAPFDPWYGDVVGANARLGPALVQDCGAFVRELGWVCQRFE